MDNDKANAVTALSNAKRTRAIEKVIENLGDDMLMALAAIDTPSGEYAQSEAFDRGLGLAA